MTKQFRTVPQVRQPADYVNALSLVAGVAERVPIPQGLTFVIFSCTSNYYAKVGDSSVTAAVPSDITDGTASELNPLSYNLNGNAGWTHISVVSASNSIATMSFYEVL